jgi:ribosomal protein L11 methyltransferase
VIELRLTVDEAHAEPLADTLLELGALSVAVEDADANSPDEAPLYGEPGLAPERHAWRRSRLAVLWPGDRDAAEAAIAQAADDVPCPLPVIENCSPVEDADWVRASQAQFPATRIGERLWIVPSWHADPPGEATVVRLDPGVAFGTGTHATTQLCLAWLAEHLPPGASVLDYGCGSGILAIAAAKLGAGRITGVDIDPQAVDAARTNAAGNGVIARYTDPAGLGPGVFDVVVANILSNPLKLLAPALLARVAPGGALVLSGVLARQSADVLGAYREANADFAGEVWRDLDGWACLVLRGAR